MPIAVANDYTYFKGSCDVGFSDLTQVQISMGPNHGNSYTSVSYQIQLLGNGVSISPSSSNPNPTLSYTASAILEIILHPH